MMKGKDLLLALGYTDFIHSSYEKIQNTDWLPARVVSEHKERYVVSCAMGEFNAEITGNLRYTASERSDYPAVGS